MFDQSMLLRGFASRTLINVKHAYTDASIRKNRGGIGVYHPQFNFNARVAERKDINRLELGGLFAAITLADPSSDLVLFSDSQTALHALTSFKHTKYDKLAQCVFEYAAEREGSILVAKVKGHSGNPGNTAADKLAAWGTRSDVEFVLPDEYTSLDEWRKYHEDDSASNPTIKNIIDRK